MIEFLLSSHPDARAIRQRFTVLIAPLLDPDGSVANVYETKVIRGFDDGEETPETLAWATWMRDWVDAGNRLDLVFNLHNVESGEGPHLFPWRHEPSKGKLRAVMSHRLHRAITDELPAFHVQDRTIYGTFRTRLGGWLRRHFGTHMMFYEVNSQAPGRHLSLYELKTLGVGILRGATTFMYDRKSTPLRREIEQARQTRYERWARYREVPGMFPSRDTVFVAEKRCLVAPVMERYEVQDNERGSSWLDSVFEVHGRNGPPERLYADFY